MKLCETGMFKHKLKRKYNDDITTYRCKPCKKNYDSEILGSNRCPRCNVKMKYTKLSYRECIVCKNAF